VFSVLSVSLRNKLISLIIIITKRGWFAGINTDASTVTNDENCQFFASVLSLLKDQDDQKKSIGVTFLKDLLSELINPSSESGIYK
jgi:hypothetical protein